MELISLNKEYNLVRQDNMEKFMKVNKLYPTIVLVEEYWITSDETMGNRCAFFESYRKAEEYANRLAENHSALNENNAKPFSIFLNGKETKIDGHLDEFLAGKIQIGK
ncbi:MAG: hypothetical protein K6G30_09285 [Acetatifactor sp.]|nr:hypothetical protein [Acetatifactor sp.]